MSATYYKMESELEGTALRNSALDNEASSSWTDDSLLPHPFTIQFSQYFTVIRGLVLVVWQHTD